jgi:hypothetical protein
VVAGSGDPFGANSRTALHRGVAVAAVALVVGAADGVTFLIVGFVNAIGENGHTDGGTRQPLVLASAVAMGLGFLFARDAHHTWLRVVATVAGAALLIAAWVFGHFGYS